MAAANAPENKSPGIVVYFSSVSGSTMVSKHTSSIKTILETKKIKYESIDVSTTANQQQKDYMHLHSKNKDKNSLPQIFVRGSYKGGYDEFNDANETGTLEAFLA